MPIINFLPPDLVPKSLTVKIAKAVNRVVLVGFALFICSTLVLIALFVLNMTNLSNLTKKKTQALELVKNNQAAEQSLYLVRDRIAKIKTIQSKPSSQGIVAAIPPMLAQLPGSLTISQANLSPTLNDLTFEAPDSQVLSQLMATVIASSAFSTVDLKSFSYTEANGYVVKFNLLK